MKLSLIVAAAENDVIGNGGELPWQLSADLRRFKKLTMGHHIIMGRKTYESIGRLLPGRTTVILSRQEDYNVEGAKHAMSPNGAIEVVQEDDCPFVVGGAEIYRVMLPWVTEIQLTRVHASIDGDTKLPAIDWDQWELIKSNTYPADQANEFEYSFEVFRRASPTS